VAASAAFTGSAPPVDFALDLALDFALDLALDFALYTALTVE
jgi:hypothetical protein